MSVFLCSGADLVPLAGERQRVKHNLMADPTSVRPQWQVGGTQPNNSLHVELELRANLTL